MQSLILDKNAMRTLSLLIVLVVNYCHCTDSEPTYCDANCQKLWDMNQELMQTLREMDQRMMNMERTVAKLQAENTKLNQRLVDIENSGSTRPNVSNSSIKHTDRRLIMDDGTPVAFLASLNAIASEDHLGVNQNIQFDTVTTNLGGAFNVNHGIFTVPKSGVYLISATVMSWIDSEVRACIMVNGKRTVSMFGHGSVGRHEQGTQVAVIQLQTGDTVTVENIDLTDISIWGDRYTSFTGVLLYEME